MSDGKTETISLRLSLDNLNRIDERALRLGMNRTDYITECSVYPSVEITRTLRAYAKLVRASEKIKEVLDGLGRITG